MPEHKKNDVVRAEILKAAERVFQKWGSTKTTMEDIAREAGKGKSTLYYYYESKEEIFDAVVTTEFERILQKAKALAENAGTARERLIKYIVGSLTEMNDKSGAYTIIRDEIKHNQSFIRRLRDMIQMREERYIEGILRAGLKDKEFAYIRKSEIATAAKTITGMMHALELYLLLENDDSAQIDIAVRFIANGL